MQICVKKLCKIYSSKKMPPVEALKGVSFELPSSGLVFILGKSGCGKTTLMNIIGGLDGFDEGDVTADGKSLKSFTEKDYDEYRNRRVGFVFQENNLFDEYTVEYNVGMALLIQGEKEYKERVKNALKAVEMEGYEGTKPNRLSGGQKQRVAIARAIVKQPELLLCDEPTGALDSETGETIFELLKGISKNTLVVVVSHDRESAEKYGDRIIELKSGQVISDRTASFKEGENSAKEDIAPVVCGNETKKSAKKRCGFSLKNSFKLGAGFLIARPIRLAIAFIICLITVVGLGVADTANTYNKLSALAQTMDAFNVPYVAYQKENDSFAFETDLVAFGKSDEDRLKELVGEDVRLDKIYSVYSDADYNYETFNSGFIEIDESLMEDYGFELAAGRLPQSYDEAVITLYTFNMLKTYGFEDISDYPNASEEINEYSDILYKEGENEIYLPIRSEYNNRQYNKDFKVCGILDTNFNEDLYGGYMEGENIKGDLSVGLYDDLQSGMHSVLYLKPGYYLSNFEEGFSPRENDYVEVNGEKFSYDLSIMTESDAENIKAYTEEDNYIYIKALWITGSNELLDADFSDGVFVSIGRYNTVVEPVVEDLILEFARENYDKIAEEFEKLDFGVGYEAYATYLLSDISKEYGNAVQPGYDFKYFLNEAVKILGEKYADVKSVELTYTVLDLANELQTFKKSYPVKGILVYDTAIGPNEEVRVFGGLDVMAEINEFREQYRANSSEDVYSLVTPCPDSINDIQRFIDVGDNVYTSDAGDEFSYIVVNEASSFFERTDAELRQFLNEIFKYISIAMAVVSVLIVFYYMSGVVEEKRKEIGIMRALGVNKRGIIKIFAADSVIFIGAMIVLGIIFAAIGSALFNTLLVYNFSYLAVIVSFGIRQAAIIAAVAIFATIIGILVPIIRITRAKPVDIIAGRK